ncbi:hydrogen peroxide-inducible genes activator [Duodenibacillus massiliensis]|mgnify:FL=1|jgi:hydrogen peroxide-inducible gene activator|uniref:hydrogen peroxide-inducible genes activator n=1 Tax=Duodenibacillus massiliensis TaxID=1852381 RepID=UPI000EED9ADF|nr:hydrogen peroxide-inducible genes activator [uncultured Duodenibacillus sp.]HAF65880.1 LysR family transcriptional regulator [Sutterella sp.]
MTLTELKYVLAVAQEHHFGRAAESCSVSQPSLSVAVRKLEEELGVKIFERKSSDVTVTPIGKLIVERAQRVLEDAALLRVCAQQGKDPLRGELRLGTICTIAPYLIPDLVSSMHKVAADMPLILTEGLTANLLEQLKSGQLDAAIVSLPIDQPGIMIQPLYDEEFVAVVPANHPLAHRPAISRQDVKNEPMLLLGSGHCFRDQVLDFCADTLRSDPNAKKSVEGSSLQTICYMVAQGLGVTILPSSAVPFYDHNPLIRIVPFERPSVPKRRVVLAWRKTFPRVPAVQAVQHGVELIRNLHGCRMLTSLPAVPA